MLKPILNKNILMLCLLLSGGMFSQQIVAAETLEQKVEKLAKEVRDLKIEVARLRKVTGVDYTGNNASSYQVLQLDSTANIPKKKQ